MFHGVCSDNEWGKGDVAPCAPKRRAREADNLLSASIRWRGDESAIVALLMTDQTNIPGGVVHDLPADVRDALELDSAALATWNEITPLARNEWICWIESAKKAETRRKRIDWGCSSLRDGKRRPCCWPGCPHR
jgi:hypothetical protein